MSIPPLVCSTPPPPDQCDDDKNHEDFDLSYRLSQDEDDAYDYSSFSSYNNFQTPEIRTCDKTEQDLPKPIVSEIQKETEYDNSPNTKQYIANNNILENNGTQEIKLKCEEDINIEDLNLEVNEDIATNIELEHDESEIEGHNVDELKETPVSSDGNDTQHGVNTASLSNDESAIVADNNCDKVSDTNVAHGTMDSENMVTLEEISIEPSIKLEETIDPFLNDLEEPAKIQDTPPENNAIDDDFGDFDNFQFTSPENKITNVVTQYENPWEKNDTIQSDFGSFTATFEDVQFKVVPTLETKQEPNNELGDNQTRQEDNDLENDDFGDFDDFKSSTVTADETETTIDHSTPCQDVPVLNLHSNENEQQIMESITKVLTAIFLEEMTEPDSQFEGKLESLLRETWGHLLETDERQPYIVNWNNSLGQKTLLKALCIDSRNILFGPKWNTGMPKYAANLSVAPLQPQKPLSPPNASQSEINTDKASSKPTTWSDPFTSDGQEFTYAEALLLDLEHLMATLDQMAHNHSTLKISELLSHARNPENDNPGITTGPTDLDVFEGAMSTKSEKIFSSTLGVQPLRQINLPDTHIFTPTDSETPRSKTIHYDSSPTVLVPQPVMSDNKKQTESMSNNTTEVVGSSTEDDKEYWEFQDFKSTSEAHVKEHQLPLGNNSIAPTSESAFTKSSVVFQTEPLQPIKVEPTIPTLNWPEPGEVKGAFDDFSDFVSTSQAAESQVSAASDTLSQMETSKNLENFNDLNDKSEKVSSDILNHSKDDFDDDFNTFQSALPSEPTLSKFNKNMVGNSTSQVPSSQIPDFDYAFPKTNSIKSDTISFPSITRPNEALSQILGHNSNTTEIMNKNPLSSGIQLKNNVLQPVPATSSAVNTQNQQKTAQILQPLSLESYSQINWPSPGIDLQDLSRFNPVETLQSLKSDLSVGGLSKGSSPVHNQKSNSANQVADDDVWGEFVSSNPKQPTQPKKTAVFADDDEWTDFISSPSVKPQNGLNTISLNVHTNSNILKNAMQNTFSKKSNQAPLDIPTLNYITPKAGNVKSYNERHFQNL